jgi:hypothetical protein
MSETKSVKYNPDLFKIPSGTQKRKKAANKLPIKIKPVTNKTIKNKILDEIRKNQEKQYKSLLEETPKASTEIKGLSGKGLFDNDFQKSVEYMQTFADKHKEEAKLNKTLKSTAAVVEKQQVGGGAFSEIYSSPPKFAAPTYGCLKNGNLPTYRNYCNRTAKSHGGQEMPLDQALPVQTQQMQAPFIHAQPTPAQQMQAPFIHAQPTQAPSTQAHQMQAQQTIATPLVSSSKPFQPEEAQKPLIGGSRAERIKSPAELLLIEKVKQKAESTKPKPIQKKIKKIMRRTYRTGKDKYRPKVSVLLPNKTIRRNVTTKSYLLKQTPIEEIRKTLLKQGFIKIGSSAPNDVLRKMYESIQMIGGDINNHNPDNLLYNFFNEKKKD